jgi:hypothetical protein
MAQYAYTAARLDHPSVSAVGIGDYLHTGNLDCLSTQQDW